MRVLLFAWFVASSAFAVEMEVKKDVFYTEAKDVLQALDVYSPEVGDGLPVVVWIHGGGWKKGDKAALQK
jgi:arylformamidase